MGLVGRRPIVRPGVKPAQIDFVIRPFGVDGDGGQGGTYAGRTGGKAVGAINDPAFLALISDQALRRYIITGRGDLDPPMPGWDDATGRPADFRPLTNQDITDLVALLASWRSKQ